MATRALDGLCVLDLSELVSGAYCGKLLGGFGAEVIKVESPRGDEARREGPFLDKVPHPETSALFSYLNTNKLGVTLDLRSKRGQLILKDLVRRADVLVENRGPQFLPELGITFETLHEWNPRLVSVSLSYFGEKGPYVRYKGSTLVAYALGGYMYLTGDPRREPLPSAGAQPEYFAGVHGAIAALTGLHAREETGVGLHAEVPIFEMMLTLHQHTHMRYQHEGRIQRRAGNRHVSMGHPVAVYPCRDGHIALHASSDANFERLLLLMDKAEFLQDPRLSTPEQRSANPDAVDEVIAPWFRERSKLEVSQTCQEWRVPCGYVTTIEDLFQDPHYAARRFWEEVDHPVAGALRFPGAPFRMEATPWEGGRAPLLGEHNQLVYAEKLGYSAQDLRGLKLDGVI